MPRQCLFLFLMLFPLCVSSAWAAPEPGTPEYAARMVYEGGHTLNFAMMADHACMTEQDREELKTFFASQIEELRRAGVDYDAVGYDFSQVVYTLVEQDRDLARVRIAGPYAIIMPTGTEWDEDPDVIIVQRIDGQWRMCGDQSRANMPLAEYRAWLEGSGSVAGQAPVSGPSPVEVTSAFCEAVYRIDAHTMEANMCRAMRGAGLVEMAENARKEFDTMGVDWSKVQHDFTGLRYELVRQEGGMAEVRLTGSYVRTHPVIGGKEQQEDQVFMLRAEDGRWVVCE